MVIFMRISWLKAKQDNKNFIFQKNIGLDVYEIEDLEETDMKIKELKNNYHTIVISNEIASFSSDIIKKYEKDEEINIIIARNKKEY